MQVSWLVKNNMFLGHQMTFVEFAWAHLCTLVTLSILLQYENKMIAIKLKIFIGFPILSHVRSSSLLQFIYEMGNSLITPLVRNRNGTTKIHLFENHVSEHLRWKTARNHLIYKIYKTIRNKLKCTRHVQIMIENPYNCKIKNEYGNEFIDISHV